LNKKKIQLVLSKGQSIFQEDAPVFGLFFIQKGKVKIVSSNFDGRDQIVRLANNEHLLGHVGFGQETYPIGACAIEETRVCFFDSEVMLDAFKKNFNLSFCVMMFYSKELRKSEIRTKYLAQMTVSEKIVYALIYLIETFGIDSDSNLINVKFSRTEIANIAGTNSDQVSRTIRNLKNQNIIQTQGHRIEVSNLEGLYKIIAPYVHDEV
jgi:CRP-like cAMP-binding protein